MVAEDKRTLTQRGGEACKIVVLPNDGKPSPLPAVKRARTLDPNIEGRVVHR